MPDTPHLPGGVFLSYAREDTDVARRLADALRAFGVEVWFDQSELRGGDAWDAKIRDQIRSCALFVPIVSAATQARTEGYFRREWKLAADRTHDMAGGVPFILPVIIDDTAEGAARMPDEFKRVQVTRLPQGVPSTQFVEQVKRSLAPAVGASLDDARGRSPAAPLPRRHWTLVVAAVVVLALPAVWWLTTHRAGGGVSGPPVVVLMDCTYVDRVYDPATLKSGGSNADDITDLLHDLPVTLVKEATNSVWRREREVVKEHPALVIIHRSAFFTFPESKAEEIYPLVDNKLIAFMGYVATLCPETKFIVYSRHSWEVDATAAKWRDDAVNRFPVLAGRIEPWRVPLDRATFRHPLTGQELRASVVRALGLRVTAGPP
jgi:hypothetical protein